MSIVLVLTSTILCCTIDVGAQVAKLQVRYITETEVRTVQCQKQDSTISQPKWHNVGSSYTKKITIKNQYPD